MKLKITFVMTALLSVMGAKADVIPSDYYSEPAAGTFYIYNVTQEKFLQTNGISENNHGLLDAPVAITLLNTRELLLSGSITDIQGVDGLDVEGTTHDAGITAGNVKSNGYSVWDDDWSR